MSEHESNHEAWFVYIAECVDHSYYVGIAHDLQRRIEEHNAKAGAKYTRKLSPVKLVWSEAHADVVSARTREVQLKKWTRRKKAALIAGNLALLKSL